MKTHIMTAVLISISLPTSASQAQEPGKPIDIRADGAFGFPQKDATVTCDTPELRFSVVSNTEYLFAQAVLWQDDNAELGETDDGRKIGDWSNLLIDADADGKATAQKDRDYTLNPWPRMPGLYYQVVHGEASSSTLKRDSKGRGSIMYLPTPAGRKVRADSYLIPLEEIGRRAGDKIRLAFLASSEKPEMRVNSIGYTSERPYYSYSLPRDKYTEFALVDSGAKIEASEVPEGRNTIAVASKNKQPPPKVGTTPPEVAAEKWINWGADKSPTLKDLRGKVVVVEFWATWCGPCVAGIPHLNELHEKHVKDGLVILSLTNQAPKFVEKFVQEKMMKFTVGAGSETIDAYGVTGIPHAFVVGRDGKLSWHGHPAAEEFDQKIAAELKKE